MKIKNIIVETNVGLIQIGDYVTLKYRSEDRNEKLEGIIDGIDCRTNPLDFRLRIYKPSEKNVVSLVNCEDIKKIEIIKSLGD